MSESILNKWKNGLEKTRKVAFGRIANFLGTSELDDEAWEDLETLLIQADMGIETTMDVIAAVRSRVQRSGMTKNIELIKTLKAELITRLDEPLFPEFNQVPFVIMLVGVNGSGKTTTAAKL